MITKGQTTTKQKNKTKEEGERKDSRLMISLYNFWLDRPMQFILSGVSIVDFKNNTVIPKEKELHLLLKQ